MPTEGVCNRHARMPRVCVSQLRRGHMSENVYGTHAVNDDVAVQYSREKPRGILYSSPRWYTILRANNADSQGTVR
jgi:hypothetical protein